MTIRPEPPGEYTSSLVAVLERAFALQSFEQYDVDLRTAQDPQMLYNGRMSDAELKQLALRRFKSYRNDASLEVAPLTVLLGRNNSGKSSLIQTLLLLKQTLEDRRKEVPLHLEGGVDALNLRELTWGWPEAGESVEGPLVKLEWESTVDVDAVLVAEGRPELENLAKHSGIGWMISPPESVRLRTSATFSFGESNGSIVLKALRLESRKVDRLDDGDRPWEHVHPSAEVDFEAGRYVLTWLYRRDSGYEKLAAPQIAVEMDHFIPLISINKSDLAPRDRRRGFYNGFKILYEQPLEDLRRLLTGLRYLGSTRTLPPSVYRPASVPPADVGVSGQYAAQMLHSRQTDIVHFVAPIGFDEGGAPRMPETVLARPVPEAFNHVLRDLGLDTKLKIQDIENVGFRLFFGGFPLQHVGYGLGHLLPAVVLGLVADPLRYQEPSIDLPLAQYLDRFPQSVLAAIEEPESHLHPKVQTRLAHWFVALAMSGRRFIVETHSDHLVRRLRGLVARAPKGSEVERWLADNVVVAEVEQDQEGASKLTCSKLTETGGIVEKWPADFMDEAMQEEDSIYYARLDKTDAPEDYAAETEFVHDPEDEA